MPMKTENQKAWRTRVNRLKARVTSIRREINAEKEQMVERETRLVQEARRLREESKLIEAQRLSVAHTRPQGHASQIPLTTKDEQCSRSLTSRLLQDTRHLDSRFLR